MAPQDPSGTGPSVGSDSDPSFDPQAEPPETGSPHEVEDADPSHSDAEDTDSAADSEPAPDHGALLGRSVDYAAALPLGKAEAPAMTAAAPSVPSPVPEAAPAAPEAASDIDGWFPTVIAAQPAARPAPESVEARSARRQKDDGPETASSLTPDRLLEVTKRPPVDGWRRLLHTITFGYVNVGDSDAVRLRRALEHRIAVRLGERTRYVPVLSRKGGVGKTTVTTLLGMTLAQIREDRIIAMDANPDRGTLSDRSPGKADFTARQLVQNRFMVDSFAQLSSYVAREGSRLHVLASETDPAVAQAFDDADYRAVTDILSRYYSIVLTDSGTGMVHSVMKGTLEKADAVVLVSGGSVDEARLASETLSWLEAHGRHDLVANAIVVINLSSGNGAQVNVAEIEEHFRSRVSTVVRIPYDSHLAEGSRVDLARLKPATRDAVVELAALVVDELQ
ncbi:MinD/ParA family protein [Arthrobacter sp. H20]|uniref:MinD/ParA family ATP-binding protein n=1 Tax=Arthrobacter sp. H20 TaxID=1267981 RepID=UPI00047D19D2|nr:MinD/ParA family protein [Arthrobacter sp. H20]